LVPHTGQAGELNVSCVIGCDSPRVVEVVFVVLDVDKVFEMAEIGNVDMGGVRIIGAANTEAVGVAGALALVVCCCVC
jgi:hypothetical protein